MYIKHVVKQNKGSKKKYQYLHLVESVRTKKGPRQRLILNLGSIDVPKEKHKELANCIETMLSGQRHLFNINPKIENFAKEAVQSILTWRSKDAAMVKASDAYAKNDEPYFQNVDIKSFEAGIPRSIGPEYVCHSIWRELGINDVLLSSSVTERRLPVLEALVIGRLIDPGSERYTQAWAQNRSALYELTGRPVRYSLNSYYRAGDTLLRCKSALETHLSQREKELSDLPEQICFFDLTDTYLEGQALANPKAKRGRSKEKRSDC